MNKKTVDLLIAIGMSLCLGYTALSGFVMRVLHVPMIYLHDLAGGIATVLAAIHILRKWDGLKRYFR